MQQKWVQSGEFIAILAYNSKTKRETSGGPAVKTQASRIGGECLILVRELQSHMQHGPKTNKKQTKPNRNDLKSIT